jgi:hypothetical protein
MKCCILVLAIVSGEGVQRRELFADDIMEDPDFCGSKPAIV